MTIADMPPTTTARSFEDVELWQSESPDAPPWADTSREANEPELQRALHANALFLAEDGGRGVGFVSARLEDHVGRIGDLYVEKAARGGGAGASSWGR